MTQVISSHGRKLAFGLAAALLAALGLYWWTGFGEPAIILSRVAAPSPPAIESRGKLAPPRAKPSPALSPPNADQGNAVLPATPATEASWRARPTPRVFDFATLKPSGKTRPNTEEDRFRTNEWFTNEDLRHPELYFEAAKQMPELNRPEERRDTLDFFLAYRDQLKRDLDAAGEDRHQREEIQATIERYDTAIACLRKLIDTQEAE